MLDTAVEQITRKELKRFCLPQGDVVRGLRSTDPDFEGFGEVYFSFINHEQIKAWKLHTMMTMNLIVVAGAVRFVFFDSKGECREEILSGRSPQRLTVPPGFWFGFQGMLADPNIIINVSNIIHQDDEALRQHTGFIDFPWEL